MIDLNKQLEEWLHDGIISSEQAELMRRSVVQTERLPVDEELPEVERRIPIITEILGYVGAALAIWAVAFLVIEFWADLTDWAQASLFAVLALVLFFAGAALLDADEPALGRLSGVLWAGSVFSVGGALFIVFDLNRGLDPSVTWALIGAITAAIGGAMFWRQASVAQHVVLFAAVLMTIISLLTLGPEPESFFIGLVIWAYGLVWILISRAGMLPPHQTGVVLGAIALLYGAQATAADESTIGVLLGLGTAGMLAGAGVMLREKLTIILGGIGIFMFVPQAMFHFFGEAMGGMFGLFASGLALVGLAIWFSRHREVL